MSTSTPTTAGRLNGKICLVTGGIRGFGASIVSLFVSHGARCLVLDLLVPQPGFYDPYTIEPPTPSPTSSATAPVNAAYAVKADITTRSSWEQALSTSREVFGDIPTVIVNNAGWTYSNKPTLNVAEDEFDRVFNINVKSIYLSVDVILPALLEKKASDAVFVNVSSTAALRPRPGLVWCRY